MISRDNISITGCTSLIGGTIVQASTNVNLLNGKILSSNLIGIAGVKNLNLRNYTILGKTQVSTTDNFTAIGNTIWGQGDKGFDFELYTEL